jgi:hypothetical protein
MTENMDADDFERASDLRQASDTLMERLDRLYELESRKRELSPERPEFIRLAREIEDLARALLFSSGQEVELAEAVHADVKAGDATADVSIRDTPPKRDAVGVLAEWRAAERRLQAARAGSADEDEARREVERLRIEYRQITAPTPPENPA